ncbi:uncharacterized protein LOC121739365 isoform X2 [Aricia agestis]|nr:uncharacterized protein LOC121739365 isoform X2 [Aricia agestis]
MIFVVRFPTMAVYQNCLLNPGALMVVMGDSCVRVCSFATEDTVSPYIVMSVKQNLTFQFTSNSSINQYIFANFYQVTVTTARVKPPGGCAKKNETSCTANGIDYCFTSGVSCDGIKNCGVEDWFDERRSECVDIEDNLKIWSVLAFLALFLFIITTGCHLLIRCLPPITGSFFIFTANEDNRLCIDPKLVPSGSPPDVAIPRQPSIIPISSCSSSDNIDAPVCLSSVETKKKEHKKLSPLQRKMTKTITEKVTSKFRSFANYSKNSDKKTEGPDV